MLVKVFPAFLFSCFILWPTLAISSAPNFSFYEISGKDARELRRQLDEKGPPDETGKRFDARTKNKIEYTYRYRSTSGGCKFVEFSATLVTTIIMPRWIDGDSTSSLGKKWLNYYQSLYAHESGHRDLGLGLLKEINELGRNFESSNECDAIAGEFRLASGSVFEKYDRLNRQYDLETDHGARQGARFP